MCLFPVVDHPGDIAGRQPRIEEAVHDRSIRVARHDLLDAGQHLFIAVQPELSCHGRPRPVRPDYVAGTDAFPCSTPFDDQHADAAILLDLRQAGRGYPLHAGPAALLQQVEVDPPHLPDAKLVMVRGQAQRPSPR